MLLIWSFDVGYNNITFTLWWSTWMQVSFSDLCKFYRNDSNNVVTLTAVWWMVQFHVQADPASGFWSVVDSLKRGCSLWERAWSNGTRGQQQHWHWPSALSNVRSCVAVAVLFVLCFWTEVTRTVVLNVRIRLIIKYFRARLDRGVVVVDGTERQSESMRKDENFVGLSCFVQGVACACSV